jgi:phospholipid-binding lipoprotein MlaA
VDGLSAKIYGLDLNCERQEKTALQRPKGQLTDMFGSRGKIAATGLFCALLVTGCASTPPSPEALAQNDPYEASNRQVLAFNNMIDRTFLVPTVTRYIDAVPEGGRRSIHYFLENLTLPSTFVGDVLQGEAARGGQTAGRFLVNTTLGLGGFFDPATTWFHMPDHSEDYGQTFAVWGAEEGPYLMLPFLGPSNPRDTAGLVAGVALDPTNFVHFKQHIWWAGARQYATLLDLRTQTFEAVQGIQRNSVDYYASLRSLYRQVREHEIRNGRETIKDLPDF